MLVLQNNPSPGGWLWLLRVTTSDSTLENPLLVQTVSGWIPAGVYLRPLLSLPPVAAVGILCAMGLSQVSSLGYDCNLSVQENFSGLPVGTYQPFTNIHPPPIPANPPAYESVSV